MELLNIDPEAINLLLLLQNLSFISLQCSNSVPEVINLPFLLDNLSIQFLIVGIQEKGTITQAGEGTHEPQGQGTLKIIHSMCMLCCIRCFEDVAETVVRDQLVPVWQRDARTDAVPALAVLASDHRCDFVVLCEDGEQELVLDDVADLVSRVQLALVGQSKRPEPPLFGLGFRV